MKNIRHHFTFFILCVFSYSLTAMDSGNNSVAIRIETVERLSRQDDITLPQLASAFVEVKNLRRTSVSPESERLLFKTENRLLKRVALFHARQALESYLPSCSDIPVQKYVLEKQRAELQRKLLEQAQQIADRQAEITKEEHQLNTFMALVKDNKAHDHPFMKQLLTARKQTTELVDESFSTWYTKKDQAFAKELIPSLGSLFFLGINFDSLSLEMIAGPAILALIRASYYCDKDPTNNCPELKHLCLNSNHQLVLRFYQNRHLALGNDGRITANDSREIVQVVPKNEAYKSFNWVIKNFCYLHEDDIKSFSWIIKKFCYLHTDNFYYHTLNKNAERKNVI